MTNPANTFRSFGFACGLETFVAALLACTNLIPNANSCIFPAKANRTSRRLERERVCVCVSERVSDLFKRETRHLLPATRMCVVQALAVGGSSPVQQGLESSACLAAPQNPLEPDRASLVATRRCAALCERG